MKKIAIFFDNLEEPMDLINATPPQLITLSEQERVQALLAGRPVNTWGVFNGERFHGYPVKIVADGDSKVAAFFAPEDSELHGMRLTLEEIAQVQWNDD